MQNTITKTALVAAGFVSSFASAAAQAAAEPDTHAATIRFLEERLIEQPDDLACWSKLGSLHLSAGRKSGAHEAFLDARAAFERVVELKPSRDQAWLGLAYAELGRHGFDAALEHAHHAARLRPEDPAAWSVLGDVHFALGNYVEAETLFRRLLGESVDLQSLARMGLVHEVRGRTDDARRAYDNALEAGRLQAAGPADLAWCHAMLGDLARDLGRDDEAAAHYRDALALDPDEKLSGHGLAALLCAGERVDEALPLLRHLVTIAPEAKQWIALGDALVLAGRPEEAAPFLARAEEDMVADLGIREFGHLRDLAEFWLAHGGDAQKAADVMRLDLALRRDVDSLAVAALALQRAGHHDEAARLAREALSWGGKDPLLLERTAYVLDAARAQ